MNWFIISLVFHVLRLNLCVALSPACPDRQYLNASGVCVDCTVCKESDKKIELRPCSAHIDTICGSIDLLEFKKIDQNKQYLTINSGAETSKDFKSTADTDATYNYYYYDDDADDDDYDYAYENNITETSIKELPNFGVKPTKKTSKKASASQLPAESGKKPKSKQPKYSMFPPGFLNENVSVVDPDTLIQRTKKLRKMKFKESTVQLDDHSLKIGDTKFKIGDEKNDDGRWLELSHPHIVDKKIYVDLAAKSTNKKGSTFFSSGEKQTDQEYFNEMSKLFNETSSVLSEKHAAVVNQTTQPNNDYDNNVLKNLDDIGDDDDDDDDEEEEEDEDSDEEEDEDDEDDDDRPLLVEDFNPYPLNNSDRTDSVERPDLDAEDDYDLDDFYQDRMFKQSVSNDIIAEPFVSTANWQILILVAAMSACLLFFIVVSAYICIFMRKRDFKTTFVADVDDISVRVNLMQHAGFEVDDSSNIKNYIKHLRSVKSNDEKLPIIYTRSTEKK